MRADSSYYEHQAKQKKLMIDYIIFQKREGGLIVLIQRGGGGVFVSQTVKTVRSPVRPFESNQLEKPTRRELEVAFKSLPNIQCAGKMKHVHI